MDNAPPQSRGGFRGRGGPPGRGFDGRGRCGNELESYLFNLFILKFKQKIISLKFKEVILTSEEEVCPEVGLWVVEWEDRQ